MNKRSAMLMAAGLILTLIVGGVAMSVGLTGPTPSEAGPRADRRQKTAVPIIKTVKHTVTVHKRGSATSATGTATGTSGSNSAGSVSGSIDDNHGSDGDDDGYGEDHGDHGDEDSDISDDHGHDDDHGDDHGSHGGDDHGDDDRTAS